MVKNVGIILVLIIEFSSVCQASENSVILTDLFIPLALVGNHHGGTDRIRNRKNDPFTSLLREHTGGNCTARGGAHKMRARGDR